MELIAVLRLLWRCRVLAVIGVIVAAGAAYVLGPSPTPPRAVAQTKVLLDTSRSQVAVDGADGADTLPWRAALAAETLGTEDNRRVIAAAAAIPPGSLDVTATDLVAPEVPASMPRAAVEAAYSSSRPFALDARTDGSVPIITISAITPDRASAARLTAAAVKALETGASVRPDADHLALDVRTVTPISSAEIPGGKGRKKMMAFALFLGGLWLTALALLPGLIGAARRALQDPEPAPSSFS